jgi:mannose-6-phosphate isomerase class I
MNTPFRHTTQRLAPATHHPLEGVYDLYPGYPIGPGQIEGGFPALARRLAAHERVIIDGMGGVLWDDFRARLTAALADLGIEYEWLDVATTLLPEPDIDARIAPFLGGDDPLFGRRNTNPLGAFFDAQVLADIGRRHAAGSGRRMLLYGTGAALASTAGLLVYVDVPKNEVQFRARAGSITNLGARRAGDAKAMYKRFYFGDWPPLRAHQAVLLPRLGLVVDAQRPDDPAVMSGEAFRAGLSAASRSWFRVRPWFEPGPWGGQWMKRHFLGLGPEAPNLAWSFELIAPENGLAFESDGRLLETSLDFLMAHDPNAVLGDFAGRFGAEFPIRFDYLDTFDGGNLSVQCHPRPEYAWSHFGEPFTQDETYYIVDTAPGAFVYLGFQPDVDPREFRRALEASYRGATPLDVGRFVQQLPSRPHDLFLIPHGTIHASGRDNLVLEISATPYIFTFKMYDWLRLDLDGRPRPLNIDRALDNLDFSRSGEWVRGALVAQPRVLEQSESGRLVHLPTHPDHFYDVHRLELTGAVAVHTAGSPHVLNLVAGPSVVLETLQAPPRRFARAETFVVPASTGAYRLRSDTGQPVQVVKAFLKPEAARIPDDLGGTEPPHGR